MVCEICGHADRKYRCPTCLIHYCSKDCYGKHKSTNTCTKNEVKSSSLPSQEPPVLVLKESIQRVVPDEKLELLQHSEHLRDLLKNQHLKDLLKLIDDSLDPESIMHKAMQEPLFIEYVEACMETIKM